MKNQAPSSTLAVTDKMTQSKIKVVAIDDHALVHDAISSLTEDRDDVMLVASEASGARGLRAIGELTPDVAVIDISLADMSGLALVERIAKENPSTGVVVFSMYEDRAYVQRAFAAGARAYVSKRSHLEYLLQAIFAAAGGGVYVDPAIAPRLLGPSGSKELSSNILVGKYPACQLTQREEDVVRLTALGFTAKEIAGQLGITGKSVETYKARACEKLDMKTRTQLVRYAAAQGWLAQP
jgi:DNA-binding NarL/FixJ family response regulator